MGRVPYSPNLLAPHLSHKQPGLLPPRPSTHDPSSPGLEGQLGCSRAGGPAAPHPRLSVGCHLQMGPVSVCPLSGGASCSCSCSPFLTPSSLQTAWLGCGCEFPPGGRGSSFWHWSRACEGWGSGKLGGWIRGVGVAMPCHSSSGKASRPGWPGRLIAKWALVPTALAPYGGGGGSE